MERIGDRVPVNLLYDAISSKLPASLLGANAVCVESDDADTTAVDTQAGPLTYYLARAQNGCGEGPLGLDSFGVQRPGRPCP